VTTPSPHVPGSALLPELASLMWQMCSVPDLCAVCRANVPDWSRVDVHSAFWLAVWMLELVTLDVDTLQACTVGVWMLEMATHEVDARQARMV